MFNSITLVGRLTADPELRYTNNEKAVTTFTLAVDSGFGDNKQTDFIRIVVWGKQAENTATYLAKGRLALVQGRLQIRNYKDNAGNTKYITEVVANQVKFLSPAGRQDAPVAESATFPGDDVPW